MIIQTKLERGQKGYYMANNKIQCCAVEEIRISVDSKVNIHYKVCVRGNPKDEKSLGDFIKVELITEDNIFSSREELISKL